ncbi:MAG: acyl-CoA dehydrogenase N-terminal domain-containing protein, partial [Pseudomonadota bacterium]
MPTYTPPLKDFAFVLHDTLRVEAQDIPGYDDLDRSFTGQILEEAGKIARDVLAPLNHVGDQEGCTLENGVVRTPTGFHGAIDTLRDGGWTGLDCDPDYGG